MIPYRIDDAASLLTPALAIYPEFLDHNISTTIRLLSGDPNRWRPHLKTAKLQFTMQRLVRHGIHQAKCSTTSELAAACAAGFEDVLIAFPVVGANALRVRELAEENPGVRVSVLCENPEQVALVAGFFPMQGRNWSKVAAIPVIGMFGWRMIAMGGGKTVDKDELLAYLATLAA